MRGRLVEAKVRVGLAADRLLRGGKMAPSCSMASYKDLFQDLVPWSGYVPRGFKADFLGTLIDLRFRTLLGVDAVSEGDEHVQTELPTLANYDEGWFEVANWVLAAKEAKTRYVMMSLGACFGYQAVGAYKALMMLNPMPCKLVVVEPEPQNMLWARQHFTDNGIDLESHWFVPMVVSDTNAPALFPVGSPGLGVHNAMWTNSFRERQIYLQEISRAGQSEEALQNLLMENRTGITRDITGRNHLAEIKFVSAITLYDLIAPFDVVDYIEADLQMSETIVFPPTIDMLNKRVRRIHIGTHGMEAHVTLRNLFVQNGWEVVFDFLPARRHQTEIGSFRANDGILTVRNPRL
jgi:hypothetical protein